jgi:hypothetical protein
MRLVFDRGTIVLLDVNQPGARPGDSADFPGALWDPRIAALRCPARFHQALVAELRRRGVRFADEVSGWEPALTNSALAVTLRPYQEAALAAWELSGRRGVAVMPTGSGKTRLAIAAVARANVPALCLVPTRVLLDQWARAIEELLGVVPGRLGDGEHRVDRITVATFESAWRQMHRLGNAFGLLVVDEAHHFGAGLRDEALDMCTAPLRLGLTATKPRGPTALRLDELVGPTVYELHVDELIGSWPALARDDCSAPTSRRTSKPSTRARVRWREVRSTLTCIRCWRSRNPHNNRSRGLRPSRTHLLHSRSHPTRIRRKDSRPAGRRYSPS